MIIRMAGADFTSAALRERESLAFSRAQAVRAMREAIRRPGAEGCVIVSTCNRTELWLCGQEDGPDPARLLCALKDLPYEDFSGLLVRRQNGQAVRFLFETACGLHSRIWGEDQIVTQVREAACLAEESNTAGRVLSKLFQAAVTSAKEVKTRVRFSQASPSAASAAVRVCGEQMGSLRGRKCLVVGSGQMGFLAAREFAAAGADVCMTLRRYKYGISAVPDSCGTVPYDGRLEKIADADIVLSATASPHYTLTRGAVAAVCAAHPKRRLFLDLAVPRDIEPAVGDLPECTLRTIDDLSDGPRGREKAEAEARSREIIDRHMEKFERQLAAWSSLPAVEALSGDFARSVPDELARELEHFSLTAEERERFAESCRGLLRKRAKSMLFSFRDWMEENSSVPERTEELPEAR